MFEEQATFFSKESSSHWEACALYVRENPSLVAMGALDTSVQEF